MPDQTRHVPRDDDPCTTFRLPFEPASVRRARALLAQELADSGHADTFVDDAVLVVSELVANSISHGTPNSEGLVDVAWCLDDRAVRLSVHDGGPPATLRPGSPTDTSTGGRGLVIVDHLCDSWHVEHEDGLRVTAELRSGTGSSAAEGGHR